MKIKSISATFGNLKNDTLKFSDGLNIVHAPNESGKSTWCAFIRAMLYGINTSDRDKTGYLSDKNRYRPWSGDAMCGTMEIERDGRSITLQRSSLGSSPMKKFSAVYTGTAEPVDDLNGANAGEELTGVSESVFERTAFIRQAGIRIDQTNELEKRIASIVSSGDEQQSYSETDGILRAWQRKLKHNRSGLIPQLENELAAAETQYNNIQSAADDISELRQETERLKAIRSQLEEDLVTIDKIEAKKNAEEVWDLKKISEEKQAELGKIKQALTVNGRTLTRSDTAALREACASLPLLGEMASNAEASAGTAAAASRSAEEGRNNSVFYPSNASEIADKSDLALELEKKNAELNSEMQSKRVGTILIYLLLIALCAVVIFVLHKPILSLICIAAAIAKLYFIIKARKEKNSVEMQLKSLLGESGFDDAASFKAASDEYSRLCAEADKTAADLAVAEQSRDAAAAALDSAKKAAISKIQLIIPGATDVSSVTSVISKIDELIDRYAKAEFEASAAKNAFESRLSMYNGTMPELDAVYIPPPLRSREDTKAYLSRINTQLEMQSEKYNLAAGHLKAMGDPVIVSGRIKELGDRLTEANEKYITLGLAISVLADANTELSTRFSPLISAKSGEIMNHLTDGKYESLVFDKSFQAQAKENGDPVSRPALALSTGTNDQLYLALRLAICDAVLPGADPCPIILDDALVNLDDKRTLSALNELLEIAKNRQIILFSCHSREAELLRESENVNIINL